ILLFSTVQRSGDGAVFHVTQREFPHRGKAPCDQREFPPESVSVCVRVCVVCVCVCVGVCVFVCVCVCVCVNVVLQAALKWETVFLSHSVCVCVCVCVCALICISIFLSEMTIIARGVSHVSYP